MIINYRIGLLVLALVASMSAIATANQPVDISIRFNGGGSHNKIYAGRDNVMEILIRNDVPIRGMSLGFQFTNSSGLFSWVTPYGTVPIEAPCVKEHGDMIGAFDITEGLVAITPGLPDTILVGGAARTQSGYLPTHSSLTVFASMKLRIPAGQAASSAGFCVDNIFVPPAGTWQTVDGNTGFPPTFNGQENEGISTPDAPPICFDIVAQSFIRGDVNDDMNIDLADLSRLIQYMFFVGPSPKYPESADINSDGKLNVADIVFLIRYLFLVGPEPEW